MMKTPDDIKKGLKTCKYQTGECEGCPYVCNPLCIDDLEFDALAYIRQLERENASLDKALKDAAELMRSGMELMRKRIEELERERDAAVNELKAYKWYEGENADENT